MSEIEQIRRDLLQYQRLAYEADVVARARGDRFGLCDSINNASEAYPSQWSHDLIERARKDLKAMADAGGQTRFAPRLLSIEEITGHA